MSKTFSEVVTYPKLKKYTGLLGKHPIRSPTVFLGVELEVEHVDIIKGFPSVFSKKEDLSLKVAGAEFVTIPIQFQYLEQELLRLFAGISADSTVRCSTHVHVNARDFNSQQLIIFVLLYCVFENSLFNYSGTRQKNPFCISVLDVKYIADFFGFMLYNIETVQTAFVWNKYIALNLCPLIGSDGSDKIGTIEFRHMQGTKDVKYILDWCSLIVSLKLAAKKLPLLDVLDHIKTMNTTSGYYWLCQEVFGEWAPLINKQETFKNDVETNISKLKALINYKSFSIKKAPVKKKINTKPVVPYYFETPQSLMPQDIPKTLIDGAFLYPCSAKTTTS